MTRPSNNSRQQPPDTGALELPTDDPSQIRRSAMDLLARREHGRAELALKLSRRYSQSAHLERVLDTLCDEGLLSDTRYAESFARQRVLRGQGPLRLRQEMRQKGLSDAAITAALDALDIDWEAQARAVYSKKFGRAPAVDRREQARRARFMQYRGFGADIVASLLESSAGDC